MLNQLQEELKVAMKSRDKATITGLRNIIGKLKSAQIDRGKLLNSEESMKILKSAAKQLKESVVQYNKGDRKDLAEKELFELSLIEKYLPELSSSGYNGVKIRELLQMSSGIRFDETYSDMNSDINRYWRGFVLGDSQDAFAASCIMMNFPLTCTGRNIAFTKKAFNEVNGYENISTIILHKTVIGV